ncbi:MAG: sugar ABC transporter permease [Anaerolineae bacterium]|nr:sugar ABC transporter permease [Anaerolineae bacterium]
MATVTATPGHQAQNTDAWLTIAVVWHALLCVASLGGTFWLWQTETIAGQSWLQTLLTVLLLLMAAASGLAAPLIIRRDHRGRVLSLVVNYLGFLVCFFGAWHVLGIFSGLNDLAGTFGRGIPFLFAVFIGYLVGAFGDRFEDNPAQQQLFQRIGRIIMLVAFVMFLFAIGLVQGLIAIAGRIDGPLPIALAVGSVLFATMIWVMWRQPAADAMNANNSHTEMLNGYLFLSPNLLGFLVFFAGPLLFSLYISFTDSDAFSTPNWVGFDNYADILNMSIAQLDAPNQPFSEVMDVSTYSEMTRFNFFGQNIVIGAEDRLFWLALRNTIVFVLVAVPLSVIPALFLSNLLNSKIPGMKFFRAVYFIPSIAAVVGIALIWQLLFNATIGYINYFIATGIEFTNQILGTAIADPQIRWLSDSRTALLSVIIIVAWQTMGFNTVLFLAGLQNIPKDLYEAATVDGAGSWAQFWRITLPMLAPTTFFVVTMTTIQAMQVFDHIFILMNPPAGPNNSTLSMVLYLYQKGFQRFEQGYASAIAWVLFIFIFALTFLRFQRERASAYEG